MIFKLILLALPALALAKINVDVSGTYNKDLTLDFSGIEFDVVSDKERESFKITDRELKQAIESFFGKWPTDVYVKSPTPWGDLYKKYGWRQVTRILAPLEGRIAAVQSQPQIVMQQLFENNNTKGEATFNVAITQTVENTKSTTWSSTTELSVGQEINYGFNIEVVSGGGTTSIGFSSSYGEETSESETVTVGSTSGLGMVLQPGQAVVAELQANRGSITVEMEYEASVSGSCAVNYENPYKGHHFYALDLENIMAENGIENNLITREVVKIGFYSNSRVVVRDRDSDATLLDIACD